MSEHEMYNSVCKPQFDGIMKDCAEIKIDVGLIKTKVYNGFGDSIARNGAKIDALEKNVETRLDKMDNRQWATLIMLFMILAGILIPKLWPEKSVSEPTGISIVQEVEEK